MCDETLSGDLTALSARVERLEDGARRGKILRSAVPAQTGQASSPAPDDITLGRLDNDRVRGALAEEAAAAGAPARLAFRVGEVPVAAPEENLQNLLKFGSQFDNIEIK